MKGKITIEVDFDKNNAVFIKVVNDTTSDDVRDKLITSFRQSLGGYSSWCKIDFPDSFIGNSDVRTLRLYPITERELEKESELMAHQSRLALKELVTQNG